MNSLLLVLSPSTKCKCKLENTVMVTAYLAEEATMKAPREAAKETKLQRQKERPRQGGLAKNELYLMIFVLYRELSIQFLLDII